MYDARGIMRSKFEDVMDASQLDAAQIALMPTDVGSDIFSELQIAYRKPSIRKVTVPRENACKWVKIGQIRDPRNLCERLR